MDFKPNKELVLFKEIKPDNITKGGIIMNPVNELDKTHVEAIVIKIGSNVEDINEGDKICVLPFQGSPVTIDGEEYKLIKYKEVLGIIPN